MRKPNNALGPAGSPYDLTAHAAAREWFKSHARRDPRFENPYDLSRNGRIIHALEPLPQEHRSPSRRRDEEPK